MLCLLYNRALLCSVTELYSVLQHHRALLCSVTELYSTLYRSSTLLYNIIELYSTLSALQQGFARRNCNHTRCYEGFLSQIAKHTFQSIHYYSLIIPTRCSKIQFHCSKCSQFAKQLYQQLKFFLNNFNTLPVMLYCDTNCTYLVFKSFPLSTVKCFTPSVQLTGSSTMFYNQVHFINIHSTSR